MAIEIVADLEAIKPHSPKWHELRKEGIGGSDASAVCGVSRWGTPYQVWAEKVNPSPVAEDEDTEPQLWGKILEVPVREEFARRTGLEVHTMNKMVRSVEHPFMLANVDGITGPYGEFDGVYEGKTTRYADQWAVADDGSVTVPIEYVIQGMHYLAVLGLPTLHYAVLIGGQQMRIAEVELNENLVADLIDIEDAFWQSVLNREPPAVSGADVDTLKKRWTPSVGKTVELTGTMYTTLKVRAQHKAIIKANEESVKAIDAELMSFMGDAEEAIWQGETAITWRQDKVGRLDGKGLRAAYPEIAAEHTGKPGRRFLPKEVTG